MTWEGGSVIVAILTALAILISLAKIIFKLGSVAKTIESHVEWQKSHDDRVAVKDREVDKKFSHVFVRINEHGERIANLEGKVLIRPMRKSGANQQISPDELSVE